MSDSVQRLPSLLRQRPFVLFWLARMCTTAGYQMMALVIAWQLYELTNSAFDLGLIGLIQFMPAVILTLLIGHAADRYDRRRILAFTQFLLAAASLLLVLNSRSVAVVYTCLFLTASARAFQGPARQAVLPHVVAPEELSNAITWNSSAFEVASVSGPALAGVLLASAGSRTVYAVQLGCAVLTLVCFVLLRVPVAPGKELESYENQSMLDGIRFVWSNKLILSAVSLDLFAVLFGGATALLPIFAVDVLHAGARGLGWLRAAPSIGAVSMAICLAHSKPIERAGRALLCAVAAFGAATIVFGFSRSLILSFAMLVLTGAFDDRNPAGGPLAFRRPAHGPGLRVRAGPVLPLPGPAAGGEGDSGCGDVLPVRGEVRSHAGRRTPVRHEQ